MWVSKATWTLMAQNQQATNETMPGVHRVWREGQVSMQANEEGQERMGNNYFICRKKVICLRNGKDVHLAVCNMALWLQD